MHEMRYTTGEVQKCRLCDDALRTNQGYFYGAHSDCARKAVDRAEKAVKVIAEMKRREAAK